MASKDYVLPADGGCLLFIDASPGAAKTEIVGINRWRGAVQIRIAAEPREGAANEELLRFLSAMLGVQTRSLTLTRGGKSSRKTIHITLDPARVKELLERV